MPKTATVGDTLHTAIIHHRHGTNFYVSMTQVGLTQQLYEYVKEWWNQEIEDRELPTDEQTAIDQYFEDMQGSEWYERGTTLLGS